MDKVIVLWADDARKLALKILRVTEDNADLEEIKIGVADRYVSCEGKVLPIKRVEG